MNVEAYLAKHDTSETILFASPISMKELAVGLHHAEASIADLGWLDVRPFTTRHAFHAGQIEHDCRSRGLPQEQINALGGDVLIGGTARAEGATVVTRNTEDFRFMPDVRVEPY